MRCKERCLKGITTLSGRKWVLKPVRYLSYLFDCYLRSGDFEIIFGRRTIWVLLYGILWSPSGRNGKRFKYRKNSSLFLNVSSVILRLMEERGRVWEKKQQGLELLHYLFYFKISEKETWRFFLENV